MASRSATTGRALTTAVLLAAVTMTIAAAPPDAGWRAYKKRDYPAALVEFEQRAREGDRVAQFNLAMMLMGGEAGATDVTGGLVWLQRSADAGLAQAQYNLGLLYENGVATPTRKYSLPPSIFSAAAHPRIGSSRPSGMKRRRKAVILARSTSSAVFTSMATAWQRT